MTYWSVSEKYELLNVDIIKKSLMYMQNVVLIMILRQRQLNYSSKWYKI